MGKAVIQDVQVPSVTVPPFEWKFNANEIKDPIPPPRLKTTYQGKPVSTPPQTVDKAILPRIKLWRGPSGQAEGKKP